MFAWGIPSGSSPLGQTTDVTSKGLMIIYRLLEFSRFPFHSSRFTFPIFRGQGPLLSQCRVFQMCTILAVLYYPEGANCWCYGCLASFRSRTNITDAFFRRISVGHGVPATCLGHFLNHFIITSAKKAMFPLPFVCLSVYL